MVEERRRQHLGDAASAALPVLWRIVELRGWSHAQLAHELAEDGGKIAKLLYGDRRPGRKLSVKLRDLGVAIELWDEPCPERWAPHAEVATKRLAKSA